eukprot:g4281.t1
MNVEAEDDARIGEDDRKDVYDDDDEDKVVVPSKYWTPLLWKRAHMTYACYCIILGLLFIYEFSFSKLFEEYVYECIFIFKFMQMIIDQVMAKLLRENLLIAPLMICVEVTEIIVTMGASDLQDFVLSYFVELAAMVLERLYLDPLLKKVAKLWPKWKMMLQRRFTKKRHMTREQRAKQEAEWKRINEEIALEFEGVEPLLDSYAVYANETISLFANPFIVLFLLFFQETGISANYNITQNEMIYYVMFGVLTLPFNWFLDMFLLGSAELAWGWKLYDYIAYQKYRFSVRENRWQMSAFDTLDESIAEPLQSIDMMCFSSQFYFISLFYAYGMMMVIFAIIIQAKISFNMFGDPGLFIVMFFSFVLCRLLQFVSLKLANFTRLWVRKNLQGTVDDEIAAKLAIGEGRQEDLEAERLELQAMNSERFRHRFLAKSRPWVLQHLVELLTPRTLEMPGPDGNKLIEYIRDVYNQLEDGGRRPDDRSDISSDEGVDENERRRRNWSKAPLSKSAAELLKYWLNMARKRRTLMKLVRGTIDRNVKDTCDVCGKTVAAGVEMRCDLADEKGNYNPFELDRLIKGYDAQYPDMVLDENLWQAYFRKHAMFTTRCVQCINRLQKVLNQKVRRAPGAGRATRAGDISSDDEYEKMATFEPTVIARSSIVGRIMKKWLTASRKRIGGIFPRPGAREEMERYAARIRDIKIRGPRKKKRKKKDRSYMDDDDGMDDDRGFGFLDLSQSSIALMRKWLMLARESKERKHHEKSRNLDKYLTDMLKEMPPNLDWYFTIELRTTGENLLKEGRELESTRKNLEAAAKLNKRAIEDELESFVREKSEQKSRDLLQMETKLTEARAKAMDAADERVSELRRDYARREAQFKKEERLCPPSERNAMKVKHGNELEAMKQSIESEKEKQLGAVNVKMADLQAEVDKKQAKRDEAINDRTAIAQQKMKNIDQEVEDEMKKKERSWQDRSMAWLKKSERKLEMKKKDDLEKEAMEAQRKQIRK